MGDIAKAAHKWCQAMREFRENHDDPMAFSEATMALKQLISAEQVPKSEWDEADTIAMEMLEEMQARVNID